MAAETLAVDLSQCLVARKGEVITCPECGAELALFEVDAYGIFFQPSTRTLPASTSRNPPRCRCGGMATRSGAVGRGALLGDEAPAPRLHLSTGWRDLGGE